jgi:CHASE3 domain sensor protein
MKTTRKEEELLVAEKQSRENLENDELKLRSGFTAMNSALQHYRDEDDARQRITEHEANDHRSLLWEFRTAKDAVEAKLRDRSRYAGVSGGMMYLAAPLKRDSDSESDDLIFKKDSDESF